MVELPFAKYKLSGRMPPFMITKSSMRRPDLNNSSAGVQFISLTRKADGDLGFKTLGLGFCELFFRVDHLKTYYIRLKLLHEGLKNIWILVNLRRNAQAH